MKVIDNFLNPVDFKVISDQILGPDFTWTYWHQVTDDNDVKDYRNSMFTHIAFETIQRSTACEILSSFLNDARLQVNGLKRIKINSYPWTPQVYEHAAHEDYPFPHRGALLNLTTCDGYTAIENQKIPSVANRVILFDSTKTHYGTTTSNSKRRVIVNLNYF
tara:strand:+ start:1826 stop:2311 length:486 start_codon:yes stop_codon:yes gene_type:complete